MRNLYKQNNIFVCKHDTHKHFSSKMSVYHILEEKSLLSGWLCIFQMEMQNISKEEKVPQKLYHRWETLFFVQTFLRGKNSPIPALNS